MLMKENAKQLFKTATAEMVSDLDRVLDRYVHFRSGNLQSALELFGSDPSKTAMKKDQLKSLHIGNEAAVWYLDAEPFMVSSSLSVSKDATKATYAMAEVWQWEHTKLEGFRKLYYANYRE